MDNPATANGTTLARRLTDSLHVITSWADRVVANLEIIPDDELIATRSNAKGLQDQSWRIVVACDAEMLRRVRARHGERVADGEGRMRVIGSIASSVAVSPSTVRRNVQIAAVFGEKLLTYQHILPEKEFYEAALRSGSPEETIDYFVRQREADGRFSTWDAIRYAKEVREAARSEVPIPTIDEAEHVHEYVCRVCGEVPA